MSKLYYQDEVEKMIERVAYETILRLDKVETNNLQSYVKGVNDTLEAIKEKMDEQE